MADYAHKAAPTGFIYISTISEYHLYCHYVAGLVVEGLSCIFLASKKEVPLARLPTTAVKLHGPRPTSSATFVKTSTSNGIFGPERYGGRRSVGLGR